MPDSVGLVRLGPVPTVTVPPTVMPAPATTPSPLLSLPGAVAAGFLLGILQSFASMNEVKQILPGIDQIIIYLVAVVILLTRPRGLMGRAGVMEPA